MDNQNSSAPTTDDARAAGLVHPVDLAVTAIILAGVGYLFHLTTQFDGYLRSSPRIFNRRCTHSCCYG